MCAIICLRQKTKKIGISFEQIMDECRWHIRAKLNELFLQNEKIPLHLRGTEMAHPTFCNFSKVSCGAVSNCPSSKIDNI
jgi:hypothetical protein